VIEEQHCPTDWRPGTKCEDVHRFTSWSKGGSEEMDIRCRKRPQLTYSADYLRMSYAPTPVDSRSAVALERRRLVAWFENNAFWRGVDSFAEVSNDLVILADRQGKILYGNSQSEAWTGFKAEELIGRDIKMLMPDRVAVGHDMLLQQFVKKADEAMATDPTRRPKINVDESRNVEVKHKDGQATPSSLFVSILFDSDPTDYKLCAILRDCTKICELEHKKDSFMAT
ncbi:hypothetical protein FOZ63_004873, partial [Perkinsus olseni]